MLVEGHETRLRGCRESAFSGFLSGVFVELFYLYLNPSREATPAK